MPLTVKFENDIMTFELPDILEFYSHSEFQQAMHQFKEGVSKVIIDFSKTTHIDSAGLGMLLVLREKVGVPVYLVNTSPQIKTILSMSHFEKLFVC